MSFSRGVCRIGIAGRDRSGKDLKDASLFEETELGDGSVEGTVVLPTEIGIS